MTKRMLSVSQIVEFDHSKNNLSDAMQADYKRAKQLVLSTKYFKKASESMEKIIFDNNESLQTRILAVFIAGTMVGNRTIIEGKNDTKIFIPK